MFFISVLPLVILLSSCSFSVISGRWCTRLQSKTLVKTIYEQTECKQAYHAACGWFTTAQCTHYEIVPCVRERNETVTNYTVVKECCRGYKLDPINNFTCIRKPDQSGDDGVQYYSSDESLIFGLSAGAYAGIICSFLFVLSITVLIILHALKRKRQQLDAKLSKDQTKEMTEKMIVPARV